MRIAVINSTDRRYERGDFDCEHEIEVVNTQEKDIKYCSGCFGCWYQTPGRCVQKDEMPDVLRSCINAELVVFVSQVKAGFVSAELKKINDKSIPLLSPFMALVDGEIHHAPRYETYPDYGLVLVGDGQIDEEAFGIIRDCYKRYAVNFMSELRFALTDDEKLGGLQNELDCV